MQNSTCFFRQGMLEYSSAKESATKYPGVAKFGIALEWGSGGLEFESRHSDQNQDSKCCPDFFVSRFEKSNAMRTKTNLDTPLHLHAF